MTIRRCPTSAFLLLSALALTGCTYSMGATAYPPARTSMAPSTNYAPVNAQSFNGPVAVVPGAMTAMTPAPLTTASLAPTPLSTLPAYGNGQITYFNVRPGDSLTTVATLYGVSEADLRKINNLKPGEQIAPGQSVRIPDGATAIR